jgi:hypothetical protein
MFHNISVLSIAQRRAIQDLWDELTQTTGSCGRHALSSSVDHSGRRTTDNAVGESPHATGIMKMDAMKGGTAMDDRFDRRELLLHVGDMLEALSCLAKTGRPDALAGQLAAQQESLQDFEFLRMVAPRMTVAEFGARVASAFFLWPKELLETELNHNALASTVQHDLFDGNPDGWKTYVAHMQKKVGWFGTGLPEMKRSVSDEPVHVAVEEASPVEASVEVAPVAEWDAPDEKKGWPWPQPGSTS